MFCRDGKYERREANEAFIKRSDLMQNITRLFLNTYTYISVATTIRKKNIADNAALYYFKN